MKLILSIVTLLVAALIATAMADPKYLNVRDVQSMERVGAASVSSGIAAYTVRDYDIESKVATTRIDVLGLQTLAKETLVKQVGKSFFNPIVSPSGANVIFTDGKQIYKVSVSGRAVQQLTSFPEGIEGIGNMKMDPNGKFLTFSMKSWMSCGNDIACQAKKNLEQSKATWREYTKLYLRHWDEWEVEGRYNRIFIMPITVNNGDIKTHKTIAGTDMIYDVLPSSLIAATPVPPFGGAEQYSISPDGKAISVTLELIQHDTAWRTDWKVYYIPFTWSGTTPSFGTPRSLAADNKARTQDPKFVDANNMYYLSMDLPQSESDLLHLVHYDVQNDKSSRISIDFDRSIGEYFFIDRMVYMSVNEDGEQSLYGYNLDSQELTRVYNTGHANSFSVTANKTVIYSYDDFNSPNNLYLGTFDNNGKSMTPKRITDYNLATLSQFTMQDAEKFHYNSNPQVQGWIIKPANFKEGRTYPVVHLIHGGPEGAWSSGWSYRWNPQLWAASGFVVVMINPRGSTGFGKDFTAAVLKNWGGAPFEDLMDGMDYVIKTYKYVDEKRQTAAGASYGGYMINWINGNTDRYNALVCHDGVFSTVDMWYQTDELFFSENEYGGLPWEARDLYEKWNPERYVENWKTPMLVIEGYKDYRVPWSQALASFQTLQRRGIDSKFIIFPSENHWVLNSANSIHWYDEVLAWQHKYSQ